MRICKMGNEHTWYKRLWAEYYYQNELRHISVWICNLIKSSWKVNESEILLFANPKEFYHHICQSINIGLLSLWFWFFFIHHLWSWWSLETIIHPSRTDWRRAPYTTLLSSSTSVPLSFCVYNPPQLPPPPTTTPHIYSLNIIFGYISIWNQETIETHIQLPTQKSENVFANEFSSSQVFFSLFYFYNPIFLLSHRIYILFSYILPFLFTFRILYT